MQAIGIKTALACILFGISSLRPGGHFQADEGVSLRRDAGGHFAAEFPENITTRIRPISRGMKEFRYFCILHHSICSDTIIAKRSPDSSLNKVSTYWAAWTNQMSLI